MTKRLLGVLVIGLIGTPVAAVLAHEGHDHKIMGTVAMFHEKHLEVKATDGKTTVVMLNEKTLVLRGTAVAKPDTINQGERVVVTAVETKDKDGRAVMVAKEVRLAEAAASGSK